MLTLTSTISPAEQLHEAGRHANSIENAEHCVREVTRNPGFDRADMMFGECRRLLALSRRRALKPRRSSLAGWRMATSTFAQDILMCLTLEGKSSRR